jgi:RHS repeat-associated protein
VYTYTYDAVGNRQTMVSPEGTIAYSYDAANRLTNAGGVEYSWDANGNLTSDGVRTYTYDHANRLVEVGEGTLTTQFAYNGDGARLSKTVGGDATQYVLDLAAGLAVVISDTEAIYLYGLDIIAQQQAERLYYMHDGLGSVRQLTDETGEIATNYAYDPFGMPLTAGGVYSPYRYTGEAWDAEVELLYLRARYYQPTTGRFVSRDAWMGDVWRPGTLNGFVYVTNNPVNYTDPSGLQGPEPAAEWREWLLIQFVPHEVLLGSWPDPYLTYQEMLAYQQDGYSRRASLSLAEMMLLAWFFPLPAEHQSFGPNHSFTQDVMHDPAITWFRGEWSRNNWELPFERTHDIDPRSGTWLARLLGWGAYARENWELGMCFIGRGSETAEGPIDPVGGILGSFDIAVERAGIGMVRFEVHNRMDRRSFSRQPGTNEFRWEPVARRDWWKSPGNWWGTTVHQYFYWYEPYPLGPLATRNY